MPPAAQENSSQSSNGNQAHKERRYITCRGTTAHQLIRHPSNDTVEEYRTHHDTGNCHIRHNHAQQAKLTVATNGLSPTFARLEARPARNQTKTTKEMLPQRIASPVDPNTMLSTRKHPGCPGLRRDRVHPGGEGTGSPLGTPPRQKYTSQLYDGRPQAARHRVIQLSQK